MLTKHTALSNTDPVIAKSMTGFDRPSIQGASAPQSLGAFFAPGDFLYGDAHGEIFGSAGFLVFQSVNPVCIATILIDSESWQLCFIKYKGHIMALVNPYPVDEVITPVQRICSLLSQLQSAVQSSDDIHVQGEYAQNLQWLVQNELEAALKVNAEWLPKWQKQCLRKVGQ